MFVFQGEGNSNENFFLRIVKLVLNIIAVLVLAGVISVVIKVFNYYHNNDFFIQIASLYAKVQFLFFLFSQFSLLLYYRRKPQLGAVKTLMALMNTNAEIFVF